LPRDVQGTTILYVFARIYVEIRQAIYQSGREIYRRLLRHDSAAYQIDFRFGSRHQPAPGKSRRSKPTEPAKLIDLKPADVKSCRPNSARTGRENRSRRICHESVEVLPPKGCDAAKTLESIKF
jgi:hypothetical protein